MSRIRPTFGWVPRLAGANLTFKSFLEEEQPELPGSFKREEVGIRTGLGMTFSDVVVGEGNQELI